MKRRKRRGRARLCPSSSQVQTLLFPKDRFTVAEAKHWATEHDWKSGDVDTKGEYIHLRQASPGKFRRIRTIHMGGRGVEARVGWAKC